MNNKEKLLNETIKMLLNNKLCENINMEQAELINTIFGKDWKKKVNGNTLNITYQNEEYETVCQYMDEYPDYDINLDLNKNYTKKQLTTLKQNCLKDVDNFITNFNQDNYNYAKNNDDWDNFYQSDWTINVDKEDSIDEDLRWTNGIDEKKHNKEDTEQTKEKYIQQNFPELFELYTFLQTFLDTYAGYSYADKDYLKGNKIMWSGNKLDLYISKNTTGQLDYYKIKSDNVKFAYINLPTIGIPLVNNSKINVIGFEFITFVIFEFSDKTFRLSINLDITYRPIGDKDKKYLNSLDIKNTKLYPVIDKLLSNISKYNCKIDSLKKFNEYDEDEMIIYNKVVELLKNYFN